ncbi:MAG: Hpt domain-containing protein, partial [Gammaproteobacteria bacterium]|nr:Hpt domain-containing protein [Gammaproteobacteria bacterium]
MHEDLQQIRSLAAACSGASDLAAAHRTLATLERQLLDPGAQYLTALVMQQIEMPTMADTDVRCRPLAVPLRELLQSWPDVLARYIHAPDDPATHARVLEFVCDPAWPNPLHVDELQMLRVMLRGLDEPLDWERDPLGEKALNTPTAGPVLVSDEVTGGPAPCGGAAHDPGISDDGLFDELFVDPSVDDLDDEAAKLGDFYALTASGCGRPADPANAVNDTAATASDCDLSQTMCEMFGLLADEAGHIASQLTEALTESGSDSSLSETLEEQLDRLTSAAEALDFPALQQACALLLSNYRTIAATASSAAAHAALEEAARALEAYLLSPGTSSTALQLVERLRDPIMPEHPSEQSLEVLREGLLRPPSVLEDEERAERPMFAAEQDVSLAPPADVDAELLDGLLTELPDLCAEFTRATLGVADGELDSLQSAQRIAHTLKGAANTVGISGIANLTHHIEDILLTLSRQQHLPGPRLANLLVECSDCLEQMSESLLSGSAPPPEAKGLLQDVLDWANRIDTDGAEAALADDPPTNNHATPREDVAGVPGSVDPPTTRPVRGADAPDNDEQHAALPGSAMTGAAAPQTTPTSVRDPRPTSGDLSSSPAVSAGGLLRVPATAMDELMRLTGEGMILTGQVKDRVANAARQLRAMLGQCEQLQQLAEVLQAHVDLQDLSALAASGQRDPGFDALELDRYNELHTLTNRLIESATDTREMGRVLLSSWSALDDMLAEQRQLDKDSQSVVLRTRMVEVRSIVPRLQRTIRQAARSSGKRIETVFSGEATLMDADVLNAIVDPLMHVLRNAVDHG